MMHVLKGYPRPQFVREGWSDLTGIWGFAFDDTDVGLTNGWNKGFDSQQDIVVPFTYETEKSGIADTSFHPIVWYKRNVIFTEKDCAEKLYLHFEGSDYETKVFLDGQLVGMHKGAYARFSIDLSDFAAIGEHLLVVRVEDSNSMEQLRGKQRWKKENFGCWYVQTTGIWKPVWLERVARTHLVSAKLTPDIQTFSIHLEAEVETDEQEAKLRVQVFFDEIPVVDALQSLDQMGKVDTTYTIYNTDVSEWGMKTWSPQHPNLYTIRYSVWIGNQCVDVVDSYFGMREIRIEGQRILLNGTELYQRLILDQAYWDESHLTCPSEDAMLEDIDRILALGYNGVRVHQKIEDQRFYYYCDLKGMLVWCEAPSAYRFSDAMVANFTVEWLEILNQFYNHPSIITWTAINESWGVPMIKTRRQEQQFSEMVYHLTKCIDQMRPVIVNDGWEHTISDIITLHDYEERGEILKVRYSEQLERILGNEISHNTHKKAFAEGYQYKGQPILISEYGGIAFADGKDGWGYGNKVKDEEVFLERFDKATKAIQDLSDVVGFCYTQVTDVQQEINGLLDSKRKNKVDPQKIRLINERRM